MSAFVDSLSQDAPVTWLEIAPPRGINPESLLRKLEGIGGHVDAVNLTDNAMGRVKLSALAFAAMIKSRIGLPVVLNFSCRDRNRFALTSDLLAAAALGIEAVVAISGDRVARGSGPPVKIVNDLDAVGLLDVIAALKRGDTGEGKRLLKTLPVFEAGAVANPNRRNLEREFELLARKAASGARFVIAQPVFDPALAKAFVARAAACKLKVVLGVLPIKRESMANYLRERVGELSGAAAHLDRYAGMSEEEARRHSIEQSIALMTALAADVAGFAIMSAGGPSLAIELVLEWSRLRQRAGREKAMAGRH